MPGSYDSFQFSGRIAADPEDIQSPTGGRPLSFVRFKIVVNRLSRREDGGWERYEDYFWVYCYDKIQDMARRYLYRGCVIALSGHIRRTKNDVIIIARDIDLIGDCLVCRDARRKETEDAPSV